MSNITNEEINEVRRFIIMYNNNNHPNYNPSPEYRERMIETFNRIIINTEVC